MLTLNRKYAEKTIAGTADEAHMLELLVMRVNSDSVELRIDGDTNDYLITMVGGSRIKRKPDFTVFNLPVNSVLTVKLIGTQESFTVRVNQILPDQSVNLLFDGPHSFNFYRSELLPTTY